MTTRKKLCNIKGISEAKVEKIKVQQCCKKSSYKIMTVFLPFSVGSCCQVNCKHNKIHHNLVLLTRGRAAASGL